MGILSTPKNSWGILKIEKYLKKRISVRATCFPSIGETTHQLSLLNTYIHTYIHTYIPTHPSIHPYIHTYLCTHTHIYINIYLYTHTYKQTIFYKYAHATCVYKTVVCTHTHTLTCTYVSAQHRTKSFIKLRNFQVPRNHCNKLFHWERRNVTTWGAQTGSQKKITFGKAWNSWGILKIDK